jgi:hypothetical protein
MSYRTKSSAKAAAEFWRGQHFFTRGNLDLDGAASITLQNRQFQNLSI